jgi:hypothetical protein
MELKDVILSTLAEMEDAPQQKKSDKKKSKAKKVELQEEKQPSAISKPNPIMLDIEDIIPTDDEILYLTSIRERLLVLFEGFQAPNNTNIEAKVDMTLNFLEYVLATLDNRIEKIKKEVR